MNEKRIVKLWQAGLLLLVGIAVIIAGLLVMKLNNRIVLALDGVIMCLMAWCFGIPYAELQQVQPLPRTFPAVPFRIPNFSPLRVKCQKPDVNTASGFWIFCI